MDPLKIIGIFSTPVSHLSPILTLLKGLWPFNLCQGQLTLLAGCFQNSAEVFPTSISHLSLILTFVWPFKLYHSQLNSCLYANSCQYDNKLIFSVENVCKKVGDLWGGPSVFLLTLIVLIIIQLDLGYCHNYVWKRMGWIFREIRPCDFNHSRIGCSWISLTTDQTCPPTDIAIYMQVRFADSLPLILFIL